MLKSVSMNSNGQREAHGLLNDLAVVLQNALAAMPLGKERSMFITKIEEAGLWGARALSLKEGNHHVVQEFPHKETLVSREEVIKEISNLKDQIKSSQETFSKNSVLIPGPKKLFAFFNSRDQVRYMETDFAGNQYYRRAPAYDKVIQ